MEGLSGLIIGALGGLAIFVYGMKMMGDGLHIVAGERMRSILRLFSINRYVGVVSGAVVTAVMNSSSASTVMVIGFINAGLLTLVQSLGIIFGANIGSTVTGQIIAFKIDSIVMPAIILGLVLFFIPRRSWNGWGLTILGFGFLFLGMGIMGKELKGVVAFPGFQDMFKIFQCVPTASGFISPLQILGAIGIGMLVTCILQSSAATLGIVLSIAMSAPELMNLETAVALVLGSNIGTTITAQLAAITANRVAKQAALAHTLFNVTGVIIMMAVFCIVINGESVFFSIVRKLSPSDSLQRQIANAHTIFNVATTLLLLPFVKPLAAICEKLLPLKEAKVKYRRLEPILLDTPGVALQQTTTSLRKMLGKSWRAVNCAFKLYDSEDKENLELAERLDELEARIDERQNDIASYLAMLMEKPITHDQAGHIPMLLHCVNDAERIGDHASIICKIFETLKGGEKKLSENAQAEYVHLLELLTKQAQCALSLLASGDRTQRGQVLLLKDMIAENVGKYEIEHLNRLREKKCSAEIGVVFIELLSEIHKVSRHLANIAERSDAFYVAGGDSATAKTSSFAAK
jgi:Na/Pi-cotransporter